MLEVRIKMELNLYACVCTKSLLAKLYGTRTPPESLMKQLLSLRHTQTCRLLIACTFRAACTCTDTDTHTDIARQDSNQCNTAFIGFRLSTLLDEQTWCCNMTDRAEVGSPFPWWFSLQPQRCLQQAVDLPCFISHAPVWIHQYANLPNSEGPSASAGCQAGNTDAGR